ncbi:hypothetical protein [Paraburkholderia strydomiana]|uniref:hypothetical protein n=1 Tax=Paraburkholderia strydomiana TaxID=1245417 RepID=UPI0038BC1E70
MTLSLHVRLSNGVEFDLSAATIDELTTVVQMFGRMAKVGMRTFSWTDLRR